MADLNNRLKKIQVPTQENSAEVELQPMTLEELSLMTCQFGSTHRGKTFIDLWENNQVWIAWMVSHYGKSQKIEHRRLLEFIEIEGSGSGTTPLTDQPSGSVKMGYPKAKTMPKPSMMPLIPQFQTTSFDSTPAASGRDLRDRRFMVRGRDAHGVHGHSSRCGSSARAHVESGDDASTSSDTPDTEMIKDMCHTCSDLPGDGDSLEEWITNHSSKDHSLFSTIGSLNHERTRLQHLIH